MVGWGVLVVLARILYFVCVEPQLETTTFVYLWGRGGNSGYTSSTIGFTTVLWVVAGANVVATAITVIITVLRDEYTVLPTVLGLFFAGLSVAFILSQGILTLVDAPAGISFLTSPVEFVGGPMLALATILFLPSETRRVFTRAGRFKV